MPLKLRIFIFNLVTVTTAFFLVVLACYKILEAAIVDNTYEKLALIRIEKVSRIESYFRDIITAADLVSSNETVLKILTEKKRIHPHPDAIRINDYIRNFNLLDLILIQANGQVVYTNSQEIPFHSDVTAQPKEFGKIADLYAWGLKAAKGSFLLLDFDSDEKHMHSSISYLVSPVYKNQVLIGVLVFRISMEQINLIANNNYSWSNYGLGKTGETLIYGEDWSLRNISRFSAQHTEDNPYPSSSRGNEDFNKLGETEELQERGLDYRGVRVFRSLGKLYLPNGDSWYIQVKMDESEAFALFQRLKLAAISAAIAITVLFLFLSYMATRQVMLPIQLLIENLERLGTKNLSQRIDYTSNDELGTLVSKYNQLAERLEKTVVSKKFLDSVIASLKEAIFIVRIEKNVPAPSFTIIQANDSALNTLSMNENEIHGQDLRDYILTTPEFSQISWLMKNRHSLEADFMTPYGRKIPIFLNWSLLPEPRENEYIFVFACTDITETRENETALIKAREEAINASLAKSEFLALMSHEIRTPLNAMIGMNDILKDSGLNTEQTNMVQISSHAGENLMSIINDILDLSKIEARQIVIEHIPFNLYEICHNICEILNPKAKAKNLQLKVHLQIPINTIVMGDPTRIRQILLNLIGNAIKFTEKGFVQFELKNPSMHQFDFFIHDSGSGIPAEKHHLIFKSFTQADSSITRKYGGTGLGLAICKNLVETMGGKIAFTSQHGKGSTFFFSLNLHSANEEARKALENNKSDAAKNLLLSKKIKILLVDDIDDNRFLVKAYLKKYDLEISEAVNGQEAVDMVRKNRYDLIFMDVQMPVMDGYAATQKIRELEKELSLRPELIIALSANALSEDIQSSLMAGCDDYISKPIKKEVLYSLLEKYFGKGN